MNRVSAPDPTLSSPLKVRALRIPADGSPPHLITLQTIIAEPAAPPEPSSYLSLLSHLEEDEKPRHVPDVTAFWGRSGWEGRSCAWMDYGDRSMEERGYYVFWAADAGSKFLANRAIDWRGDAFVLRVVERRCLVAADFVDVGDYLRRKRHEHLFPEYQDVDEAILQSDIVGWIARDLLQAGLVDGGGRGRDGGRGAGGSDSWGILVNKGSLYCSELLTTTPSGKDARVSAGKGDEGVGGCRFSGRMSWLMGMAGGRWYRNLVA